MKGFSDWINTPPKVASEKELQRIWDATASYKQGYAPNVDMHHDTFMDNIRTGHKPSSAILPIKRGHKLWRAAAMITFLVVAGMLLKHYIGHVDGIDLIVTSKSEQKTLSLEDGTLISLNGSSSLDFPIHFNDKERVVKLIGEAFFEVARDESKPFKVELGKATVEVLGTSFNVRSVPSENFIEVFVKKGSVRVNVSDKEENHVLSPGELLRIDFETNGIEKITNETAGNAIAWKSGKMTFKNQAMGEIFKALGRHFQVKFELNNPSLTNCAYTINFNTDKLDDAIKGLEMSCNLKFAKINDEKYEVSGTCCD